MKKIFTLIAFVCATLFATKSFAQISETFETQTDFTNLIGECWSFTTVGHDNSAPIDGIGSVASQLNSTSQITTPLLNIGSSIDISFMYQRVQFAAGGSRTLKIFLLDTAGTPTLLDNIALNDGSLHSYSNTFTNANTPGNHFPLTGKIMFQFSDNVGVVFDDLNISAPYFYPGGCSPAQSPLPVKLISFQGNMNNGKVNLQWAVAQNEINDHFEVERSTDGKTFTTKGIVTATTKSGAENYSFGETINSEKVYYRLKMFDNNQVVTYSKILVFQTKTASSANGIKIINNPITDKLTLSYSSASNQSIEIKVYDLSGRMQMSERMNAYEGSNLISLTISSAFKTGMYVVELNNGSERQSAKFVKQ
jgi:hypothetical protein